MTGYQKCSDNPKCADFVTKEQNHWLSTSSFSIETATQQRLESGQTHDDGINQGDVGEALESLDEDPEELLDIRVRDGLGDAAKHNEATRLEGGVVTKCKPLGQRGPGQEPITIRQTGCTGLHDLQQGVGNGLQRGEGELLLVVGGEGEGPVHGDPSLPRCSIR